MAAIDGVETMAAIEGVRPELPARLARLARRHPSRVPQPAQRCAVMSLACVRSRMSGSSMLPYRFLHAFAFSPSHGLTARG